MGCQCAPPPNQKALMAASRPKLSRLVCNARLGVTDIPLLTPRGPNRNCLQIPRPPVTGREIVRGALYCCTTTFPDGWENFFGRPTRGEADRLTVPGAHHIGHLLADRLQIPRFHPLLPHTIAATKRSVFVLACDHGPVSGSVSRADLP